MKAHVTLPLAASLLFGALTCAGLSAYAATPTASMPAPQSAAAAAIVNATAGAAPRADAAVSANTLAAAPVVASFTPGVPVEKISFAALGAWQPVQLRGLDASRNLSVGVRLDHVVKTAWLRLRYTYSPALVFPLSHIRITLNGEAIATVPFDREHAGQMVTTDIPLDPRFLSDYTQLGLNLVAHYTMDHCEDPESSALWAQVSPTSEVLLQTAPIRLPNDLALLPAPFFDRRDVGRLDLPFVLPAAADDATLRSAGVIASWFGALADYRNARFTASNTLPTSQHAVVVATRAQLPAGLALPAVEGPLIAVVDNPAAPTGKLLVVTGRNAAEVDQAAYALVLGKAAMSGAAVRPAQVDIGAPRQPYDAPRWLPVNRKVAFRELVDDPQKLQVSEGAPEAIRLNVRVPADLFSWSGQGVPLDLKYRYTAPTVQNNSALAISINDQLVKSFRLAAAQADDAQGHLQLPLLSGAGGRAANALEIPAFRVGSANQLQLHFSLASQKTGLCQGTASNPVQAAVDPDSTIDFSHFVHYAHLPNLAYFSNSGFPFTRYADLAQTAVVIPAHPAPEDLEAMLTMLGHMGQWTGLPALRVQVVRPGEVASAADKDLLVIGTGASPLLARWRASMPLAIGVGTGGGIEKAAYSVHEHWRDGAPLPDGSAQLDGDGALAAVIGFERPDVKRRSVVALTATDEAHLTPLLDAFERADSIGQMQGDVALVREGSVESMRVGPTYLVGELPWYAPFWSYSVRHPVLLGVLGVIAGLLLTIGAFTGLQALAARRRGI